MGSPPILLFSLGVVHEPADQPHEPPGPLLGVLTLRTLPERGKGSEEP
jgi:hypothetical protein